MTELSDSDLQRLDARVEGALAAGEERTLPTVGYGEISLVLGWPPDAPEFACKRLPAFPSRGRFDAYDRTIEAYVQALRATGVGVVETRMRPVPRSDGTVIGYVVQPILPQESLAPALLARVNPANGHPLVTAVADAAARTVGPRLGLDAQLDNWVWAGDRLTYLDVSTPMMWSDEGRPLLDLEPLSMAFPWVLRAGLRRLVAPRILDTYRNLRGVYFDLCGNLIKRRLDPWLPAFLAAANAHLDEPLDAAAVHAYYRRDARLWEAMLRVRKLDRAWQRRVRRRPYPFLLPKDTAR